MKKLILSSLAFYLISLGITKLLLNYGVIDHEMRLGLSLHIFIGLFIYSICYYPITLLFLYKPKKYKLAAYLLILCLVVDAVALVDWFFYPNWLLALGIEMATLFIFGLLFFLLFKKKK